MKCPRCTNISLEMIDYEGVDIHQCPSCQGQWVTSKDILDIINTREETFPAALVKETINSSFTGLKLEESDFSILCPECKKSLNKVNYAVSSGVIVDTCPEGHGIWFDKGEIEKVQAYREHWQDEIGTRKETYHKAINAGEHDANAGALYVIASLISKLIKR